MSIETFRKLIRFGFIPIALCFSFSLDYSTYRSWVPILESVDHCIVDGIDARIDHYTTTFFTCRGHPQRMGFTPLDGIYNSPVKVGDSVQALVEKTTNHDSIRHIVVNGRVENGRTSATPKDAGFWLSQVLGLFFSFFLFKAFPIVLIKITSSNEKFIWFMRKR